MNKVILIGRLGREPEVRHLDNGKAVANFSIATSESYKNKAGERVESAEWHNIVLWSPQAEVAERFLRKGDQVSIVGKLTTRSWDDKDGNKRYTTEVVGRELGLLGGNKTEQPTQAQQDVANFENAKQPVTAGTSDFLASDDSDELPF